MTPFDLVPPPELLAVRGGSPDPTAFWNRGRELFRAVLNAGLSAGDRVLDLGCGCGQLALPLLSYLDRTGGYDGVDARADGLEWASDAIAVNYPNFRFVEWDVRHPVDRPRGRAQPHRAKLPFAAKTFDFAVAAGASGRLLPRGWRATVEELNRVLKVGGRCVLTMDLVNADQPDPRYPFVAEACAVRDDVRPEQGVAHDRDAVTGWLARCGFEGVSVARAKLPGGRELVTAVKARDLSRWQQWSRAVRSWDCRPEAVTFRRTVVSTTVAPAKAA